MIVIAPNGSFGPYSSVVEYEDKEILFCDSVILPWIVIGTPYSIVKEDPPGPLDTHTYDTVAKVWVENALPQEAVTENETVVDLTTKLQLAQQVLSTYAGLEELTPDWVLQLQKQVEEMKG